jgi:hypothetical protein
LPTVPACHCPRPEMIGGHGAACALLFGQQPGQDTAL